MPKSTNLYWLPVDQTWKATFKAFVSAATPSFAEAVALANARLDFLQTNALAAAVCRHRLAGRVETPDGTVIRLAVLASSTVDHLGPAIQVAALRRGFSCEIYTADYGQYRQELIDQNSGLWRSRPTCILLVLDTRHLMAGFTSSMTMSERETAFAAVCENLRWCWLRAREAFGCQVIQQTLLPTEPETLGSNEHRSCGSSASMIARLNGWLRHVADTERVDLLTVDARAARDGIGAWHDPSLWHRSKQEISPAAAPMYGELVARILAAKLGRSKKCLVLDLDNTLWGGVIGDDGLNGIVLGQGNALGEAFAEAQAYVRELSRRGIILAVCSKNDEANAIEAFEKHPEMVLRRSDIVCFVANWHDKASNIRSIAKTVNIGLDALVFLDDNPFERDLVRKELPMVAVPEVGDDPTFFAHTLADAGYFESLALTEEDLDRTRSYKANDAREDLKSAATNLDNYLDRLRMELIWCPFDDVAMQRIAQLVNKTNQFNLTTRRYTEGELSNIIADHTAIGLQFRLVDRFGDNGIIAVVIGRLVENGSLWIDTWLLNCRVLGRQVEVATLNLIVDLARQLGARRIVGEYRESQRNRMVADHYEKLGFKPCSSQMEGSAHSELDIAGFEHIETFITTRKG